MPVVPMPVPAKPPSRSRRISDTRPPPSQPFAMMAAAQMHSEGRLIPPSGMSGEEAIVRSQGAARFDPDNASDEGKKLLNNLPDDIERIDRGSTIELRLKTPPEGVTS